MLDELKNTDEKLQSGKFGVWRYGLVIVLVVGIMLVTQFVTIGIAYLIEGNLDVLTYSPITLLWVSMLPFGAALVVLFIGVRFIHKIPLKNFFTRQIRFQWTTCFRSAVIWFSLAAISDIVLSILQPGNYQISFQADKFFPYLIVALILFPIQITAEESFFRGYLQPAFLRLTNVWWLAILLQAILFGLLHGANTEVSAYGILTTMPFYIGIGILLGLVTYKFLGLEAALGLHLANNLYASLMVTFSGSSIDSPALFRIMEYQPVTSLIVFFITTIVYYFLLAGIQKNNSSNNF